MADRNLGCVEFHFLLPVFLGGLRAGSESLFVCYFLSFLFGFADDDHDDGRSSDASARRAGSDERTPLARSDHRALRSVLPIVSRYISAVVFIVPCPLLSLFYVVQISCLLLLPCMFVFFFFGFVFSFYFRLWV